MWILLILLSFIYASPSTSFIEHGPIEELFHPLLSKEFDLFKVKETNRAEIEGYLNLPSKDFAMILKEWLNSDKEEHKKLLGYFFRGPPFDHKYQGHSYKMYGRSNGQNDYNIIYLPETKVVAKEGEIRRIGMINMIHGIVMIQ